MVQSFSLKNIFGNESLDHFYSNVLRINFKILDLTDLEKILEYYFIHLDEIFKTGKKYMVAKHIIWQFKLIKYFWFFDKGVSNFIINKITNLLKEAKYTNVLRINMLNLTYRPTFNAIQIWLSEIQYPPFNEFITLIDKLLKPFIPIYVHCFPENLLNKYFINYMGYHQFLTIETVCQELDDLCFIYNINRTTLLSELLHSSIKSIIDSKSLESRETIILSAFIYIKLPSIINYWIKNEIPNDNILPLSAVYANTLTSYQPDDLENYMNFIQHIKMHMESFSDQCADDVEFQNIMTQMRENTLNSEVDYDNLLAAKVIKANSTLTLILQTFELDYNKNLETILEVLTHILLNNNLDLILCVAINSDKLQILVQRLNNFLELSKEAMAEGGKQANNRATIYDISLLILSYVEILYTNNIMTESKTNGISSDEKNKLHHNPFETMDKNRVDAYLTIFLATGFELITTLMKWQDLQTQIPYVFYEIFIGYSQGIINKESLTSIMDKIRNKMPSLLISIFSWCKSFLPYYNKELYETYIESFLQQYLEMWSSSINTSIPNLVSKDSTNGGKNGNSGPLKIPSTGNDGGTNNEINYMKSTINNRCTVAQSIIKHIINPTNDSHQIKELPHKTSSNKYYRQINYPKTVTHNLNDIENIYNANIKRLNECFHQMDINIVKLFQGECNGDMIYDNCFKNILDIIQEHAQCLHKYQALIIEESNSADNTINTISTKSNNIIYTQLMEMLSGKLSNLMTYMLKLPKNQLLILCAFYVETYIKWMKDDTLKTLCNEVFCDWANQVLLLLYSILHQAAKNDNNVFTENCVNQSIEHICENFQQLIDEENIDLRINFPLSFVKRLHDVEQNLMAQILTKLPTSLLPKLVIYFPNAFNENILLSYHCENQNSEFIEELLLLYYNKIGLIN